ncbi:MAG: phosphoglycerate kinase, partial [Neisseria elongata]
MHGFSCFRPSEKRDYSLSDGLYGFQTSADNQRLHTIFNLHKGYIMAFLKLTEQNVQGKTVLIRADMNV